MKIKNVNLEWYVIRVDFNTHEVKRYNIFYTGFTEELAKKIRKKKITNREELFKEVKGWAMYHYWCKSECEIAVGSLWAKSEEDLHKIDIFYQIEKNLDVIVDYIMSKMKIVF